ncbi:MAG: DUF3631 domain-containing protein, partial [Bradyrhizobium sp.]
RLGCRVAVLDRLVAGLHGAGDSDSAKHGRPLVLPEITPWPEPVDGAALLDDLAREIRRYVVVGTTAVDAVALWIAAVHAFDAYSVFPRLAITAPEKQCGKTTLLDLITRLVPRPLGASNITSAALFRTIEAAQPTLLLDEADTYLRRNDELRGVIDAGHRRDGAVIRTVGDDHEPRLFRVWAPVVIAAIGRLPGTIEDRSIVIPMRRRRPDESVTSLRLDRPTGLDALARRAARWAADNIISLGAADPEMPDAIYNRTADNWRPLIAVAGLAGDGWPGRARDAALELCAAADDDGSAGVMLLSDLRELFGCQPGGVLFTREILDALHADETRPWSEWRTDKPITARQLAALVRQYGVRPQTVRRGSQTDKGYERGWFRDAFERYLAPQSVTQSQPRISAGCGVMRSVTPAEDVTDRTAKDASISAACDAVTDGELGRWEIEL